MGARVHATLAQAWRGDARAHHCAGHMQRWPKLGAAMRVLTTAQDTPEQTSFETYLRGELGTYSIRTLALYGGFVDALASAGRNLTEETVGVTVRLAGFDGLDEAERAQA